VASVIAGKRYGVAKGAKIVDVEVDVEVLESGNGRFIVSSIAERLCDIRRFLEANPDVKAVINLSSGPRLGSNEDPSTGMCKCAETYHHPERVTVGRINPHIYHQIAMLGGIIVCAAGHECNPALEKWTAGQPNVFTVSSIDREGKINEIYNYGKDITLYAPGEDVICPVPEGPNNAYLEFSGTSLAAPVVSGLIARRLSQPDVHAGYIPWFRNQFVLECYGIQRAQGLRPRIAELDADRMDYYFPPIAFAPTPQEQASTDNVGQVGEDKPQSDKDTEQQPSGDTPITKGKMQKPNGKKGDKRSRS
jgi:hypothetical protein